ncbi:MAG: DUF2264 domain-containing protein, partial [Bacteroidetes bacterium]|nr:DUF2264 domain-containing protein [Bacteroidota bacterium]
RAYWLQQMDRMARPVLSNLAADKLKKTMPPGLSKRSDNPTHRAKVAYLEAFGRLMSGIAPWLALEGGDAKEVALREQYRGWALQSISNAVNPGAADYMVWDQGGQPLVDASYFALSFIRCPWLWEHLADSTKQQVVNALLLTRRIKPVYSNWLLFSGMIEAFFCRFGQPWDQMRVDYCVHQFEQWYVGDGVYSDGVSYHFDYYNSYVIHPYLTLITDIANNSKGTYKDMIGKFKQRDTRYAIIQERLINADGSFPATGRSIVYRGGAFHHLADMAWQKRLPAQLRPAQVREALNKVISKTMEAPGTYTSDGWLTIGLCGDQPDLADVYNTGGSLYLCSEIFLPLGLPETDPFWADPAVKFSAQKIWSGEDAAGDHAVD